MNNGFSAPVNYWGTIDGLTPKSSSDGKTSSVAEAPNEYGDTAAHGKTSDYANNFYHNVVCVFVVGTDVGAKVATVSNKKSCITVKRVMVNSRLLGFERRAYQPYNLPAPEPTRFVNGVEFTNCFGSDAGFVPKRYR